MKVRLCADLPVGRRARALPLAPWRVRNAFPTESFDRQGIQFVEARRLPDLRSAESDRRGVNSTPMKHSY